MSKQSRFPIQATSTYNGSPVTIPWEWAQKVYEEYVAMNGNSQTLERLAERHGFGAEEAIWMLIRKVERLEKQLATTPQP